MSRRGCGGSWSESEASLHRQQDQDLADAILDRLERLADDRARLMEAAAIDDHRLRLHGRARDFARHQEVADADRAIACVHAYFYAPCGCNLFFTFTSH